MNRPVPREDLLIENRQAEYIERLQAEIEQLHEWLAETIPLVREGDYQSLPVPLRNWWEKRESTGGRGDV